MTALPFDNYFPKNGHCRPKHVAEVSHIYEVLSFYCCAVVGINIVKWFTAVVKDNIKSIYRITLGILHRLMYF
jgi:hypothetical protein